MEVLDTHRRMGTAAVRHRSRGREPTTPLPICTAPVALVLGNEAHGLPAASRPATSTSPSPSRCRAGTESLNVCMAAAVLCFEAARQRRLAG